LVRSALSRRPGAAASLPELRTGTRPAERGPPARFPSIARLNASSGGRTPRPRSPSSCEQRARTGRGGEGEKGGFRERSRRAAPAERLPAAPGARPAALPRLPSRERGRQERGGRSRAHSPGSCPAGGRIAGPGPAAQPLPAQPGEPPS